MVSWCACFCGKAGGALPPPRNPDEIRGNFGKVHNLWVEILCGMMNRMKN